MYTIRRESFFINTRRTEYFNWQKKKKNYKKVKFFRVSLISLLTTNWKLQIKQTDKQSVSQSDGQMYGKAKSQEFLYFRMIQVVIACYPYGIMMISLTLTHSLTHL